jgi:hypothetical protein
MPQSHLTQAELAARWRISPRTLERWRWLSQGPAFIKVGGSVRYRLQDVERFEAKQLRQAGQNIILGAWR